MEKDSYHQLLSYMSETARVLSADGGFPVDIYQIASSFHVDVKTSDDHKSTNVRLRTTYENQYKAVLPSYLKLDSGVQGLQRFFIAHELGHIILRKMGVTSFKDSDYWLCEELCNLFARNLLIPDKIVDSFFVKCSLDANSYLRGSFSLAKYAHVNWHTTALRLSSKKPHLLFFAMKESVKKPEKLSVYFTTERSVIGIGKYISNDSAFRETMSRNSFRKIVPISFEALQNEFPSLHSISSAAIFKLKRREECRICLVRKSESPG
ncbi:MAG: ImmA/IrrE family metallo-endopeptidase [Syntrophales bacterium]|jgi:hypothetical protein